MFEKMELVEKTCGLDRVSNSVTKFIVNPKAFECRAAEGRWFGFALAATRERLW
jgi:hypothetical protein